MRTKKEQKGRERSMRARIRSRCSGPCAPSPRNGWARGPSVRRSREGPGLSASFSSPARTVHRRRGRTGTVYRAPVRLCCWRSFFSHYGSPMQSIEQFFSILPDRPRFFFAGAVPPGSAGGSPLAPRPRAVKVSQPKFRPITYFHDFAYHTIAFPVPSAGGDARAMRGHRQAFPTPRGSGKRDPKGGLARPPDVVARRL